MKELDKENDMTLSITLNTIATGPKITPTYLRNYGYLDNIVKRESGSSIFEIVKKLS